MAEAAVPELALAQVQRPVPPAGAGARVGQVRRRCEAAATGRDDRRVPRALEAGHGSRLDAVPGRTLRHLGRAGSGAGTGVTATNAGTIPGTCRSAGTSATAGTRSTAIPRPSSGGRPARSMRIGGATRARRWTSSPDTRNAMTRAPAGQHAGLTRAQFCREPGVLAGSPAGSRVAPPAGWSSAAGCAVAAAERRDELGQHLVAAVDGRPVQQLRARVVSRAGSCGAHVQPPRLGGNQVRGERRVQRRRAATAGTGTRTVPSARAMPSASSSGSAARLNGPGARRSSIRTMASATSSAWTNDTATVGSGQRQQPGHRSRGAAGRRRTPAGRGSTGRSRCRPPAAGPASAGRRSA